MDTTEEADLLLREASADMLFADMLPRLHRAGWAVFADSGRSLYAMKGQGRIYLPGGICGRWHTRVAQVTICGSPDHDSHLTPSEMNECAAWKADLDQSVPVDLVLAVAERAAGTD